MSNKGEHSLQFMIKLTGVMKTKFMTDPICGNSVGVVYSVYSVVYSICVVNSVCVV